MTPAQAHALLASVLRAWQRGHVTSAGWALGALPDGFSEGDPIAAAWAACDHGGLMEHVWHHTPASLGAPPGASPLYLAQTCAETRRMFGHVDVARVETLVAATVRSKVPILTLADIAAWTPPLDACAFTEPAELVPCPHAVDYNRREARARKRKGVL